jgi:GABA permease
VRAVSPRRVLIVAHETADSPELIEAVTRRADDSVCTFTLLVPARAGGLHRVSDPHNEGISEAEERLELAIPLLSEAAGEAILGVIGAQEPLAAVQDALNVLGFDEVIISMLPVRESRWFRLELPRKVRALGVAVTEVITSAREVDHTAA